MSGIIITSSTGWITFFAINVIVFLVSIILTKDSKYPRTSQVVVFVSTTIIGALIFWGVDDVRESVAGNDYAIDCLLKKTPSFEKPPTTITTQAENDPYKNEMSDGYRKQVAWVSNTE